MLGRAGIRGNLRPALILVDIIGNAVFNASPRQRAAAEGKRQQEAGRQADHHLLKHKQ